MVVNRGGKLHCQEFGQSTAGHGLFAQDARQRRLRVEVLQPKAGVEEVLSNMTELVWPTDAWKSASEKGDLVGFSIEEPCAMPFSELNVRGNVRCLSEFHVF